MRLAPGGHQPRVRLGLDNRIKPRGEFLRGGYRLFVDRLWPRGVSKDHAELDAWMKEIAPSSELRRWFDHDASRWVEFKRCYSLELDTREDLVSKILALSQTRRVTFIYSARDTEHSQVLALAEYIAAKAVPTSVAWGRNE